VFSYKPRPVYCSLILRDVRYVSWYVLNLFINFFCLDLSVPVSTPPKELVHVTKNRPRPAKGRRPPTRASAGQQNSAAGPEIVVDNFDVGIDSFFNKPAGRPRSAA
jgi:hypothetical protein